MYPKPVVDWDCELSVVPLSLLLEKEAVPRGLSKSGRLLDCDETLLQRGCFIYVIYFNFLGINKFKREGGRRNHYLKWIVFIKELFIHASASLCPE